MMRAAVACSITTASGPGRGSAMSRRARSRSARASSWRSLSSSAMAGGIVPRGGPEAKGHKGCEGWVPYALGAGVGGRASAIAEGARNLLARPGRDGRGGARRGPGQRGPAR